jgi:hypothetical protein
MVLDVMTPGRPESGGALTNDSEVKGPGCDRFHYRPAILDGIFMPLPWSASANPLEPLRGPWQRHVGSSR